MIPASSESLLTRRSAGGSQRELPLQAVSLTNGRYTAYLNGVGAGHSKFRNAAVTRCSGDAVSNSDGVQIYVRDLDENLIWSAGYQPTRIAASQYEFSCDSGVAEIFRVDQGIECRLAICVSPQYDFEIRRCQLKNSGPTRRRLEITSYLEWVLGSQDADESHPAFSKLFVETEFCAERGAILARRRARSCDETTLQGFHSIVFDPTTTSRDAVSFETNRTRFIGRGRTLERPMALGAGQQLTGDSGPVLDPIAALRIPIELEADETREIAFVVGAATTNAEIDRMLEFIVNLDRVRDEFSRARLIAPVAPEPTGSIRSPNGSSSGERIVIHPPHRTRRHGNGDATTQTRFAPDTAATVDGHKRDVLPSEPLQFNNGYGGFSTDDREYVIRIQPDDRGGQLRPPLPWANVIANENAGFLVTESGAGYTWSGNSRLNRLTAWHNDPVIDPHSEALWIRDEDAGVFWSPLPGPTPAHSEYLVRHGFGYTVFEHTSHELSQEITMFMARDEPVKLTRLRLVNQSGRSRRLSLFSYLHWALGGLVGETASAITTTYCGDEQAIRATNPHREHYAEYVAFSSVAVNSSTSCDTSYSCDRATFLGRNGDTNAPAAIVSGDELDRRSGKGLDPCAAWQMSFELSPGEVFECTFLLGEGADRGLATKLIRKYADGQRTQQALAEVTEFWRHTLSAITIETPNREIDVIVNGWLSYQNLSCRMWGRSAYYQPGGAFGFRDQLQDAAALIHHRPDITKTQILRHASQQFVEGDVMHWWHPDTGYGLRTRFSDDLLWLPLIAAEYVQRTGDATLLDEEVPFIAATPLTAGQQEAYLRPEPAGLTASLYEHCCRALDRGLTTGAHGLPLIGCGDWNDGFSRVGRQGKGESVWLGFFIDYVLQQMLPICSERGDEERVAHYTEYRKRLAETLNSAGWDGAWYRRAYYDNGQPIGSATNDECQIDALATSVGRNIRRRPTRPCRNGDRRGRGAARLPGCGDDPFADTALRRNAE